MAGEPIPTVELIETDLTVSVFHDTAEVETFTDTRKIEMHPDFLNTTNEKKHNITNHSKRFKNTIQLNHKKTEIEVISKWKVCMVNFGMNVGSEINGTRPAIIYKASSYKYGEDIIVLPITSFEGGDGEEKSKDSLDVIFEENKNSGIGHKSLIKIRQIRCVSKKRLKKEKKTGNIRILGIVDDEALRTAINTNIVKMFGLDGSIN